MCSNDRKVISKSTREEPEGKFLDLADWFQSSDGWQVFSSGQSEGRVKECTGPDGKPALRFEYDFHGGGGFVVIRRVIDIKLPQTFEFGCRIRGNGPANHFECKFASDGGKNVWRHLRQHFELPAEWSSFSFHERDLPFAWGPAGGGSPAHVEAVEFAFTAGPGGRGFLELTSARLEDQTLDKPLSIRASSSRTAHPPEAGWDDSEHGWKADERDASPWWAVDFGRPLRFGGLVVDWPEGDTARGFRIEWSMDGNDWRVLHHATRAQGARSHIATASAEARHLRFVFESAHMAGIRRLHIMPDAFSASPNEFIHAVAKDFPRSWHPRYWHREQSYWSPVGSPHGRRRGLINEEGQVEVDEAGFSFEPFLLTPDGMFGWADLRTEPAGGKRGLPMPHVVWRKRGIRLEILPRVEGAADELILHVTYRLRCSLSRRDVSLAVAIRPYQVNPPWQAFRNLGGRSHVEKISLTQSGADVDGRDIRISRRSDVAGASMFEEGGIVAFLSKGKVPEVSSVHDQQGLASGAWVWKVPADTGFLEVTLSMPYDCHDSLSNSHAGSASEWARALGKVRWSVPDAARPAFDCLRSAAGHILIHRDGPAIQPGPRRYTRSWIRDCVIMGAALAKSGLPHALEEFIRWYASFQREDGFVPCVVDRDGIDWLVEHDSHGQFLWGVRELLRNGTGKNHIRSLFPHVRKAAGYLLGLRKQRMTEEFQAGTHTASYGLLPESISLQDEDTIDERSAFYGLLPESASHEGYLAHPVHSYWDDFWGIRGLEAAADLAEWLGHPQEAAEWRAEASVFAQDVVVSLRKVITEKNLTYIPGSVEWADFDPTATANAIAMLDFADALPQPQLDQTLEKYLDGFRQRRDGTISWNNYSAYEIRIIGAFVRLGRREVAHELLDFFLSDRRPREWNQWPEISWFDPRSPGHLGDVPHTWIAAEYILALASMVACEREQDRSLILAQGLSWDWISAGKGIGVKRLPTRFGKLDFHIHVPETGSMRVSVSGRLSMPPGGLFLVPPLPDGLRMVESDSPHLVISVDGKSAQATHLPMKAIIRLGMAP